VGCRLSSWVPQDIERGKNERAERRKRKKKKKTKFKNPLNKKMRGKKGKKGKNEKGTGAQFIPLSPFSREEKGGG